MPPDRYRLVEKLGQGGMATVWRAEDTELGRQVAVKVLLPFVAERDEGAARFQREARALAGIRHPNVLQLFDYLAPEGETPARLVMELLSGPSLQRFVVDAGAPLPEVAALIGAEVAAGLCTVHACGIVHRDVKPENVLLDGGRVVLTDFGIARVAVADRSALTQTGAIIGSPTYMSPEQTRGEAVDARSDQFSLGSLLYFLATGAVPFSGPHPLVVMQRIERAEVRPAGARNPRVPAWLDRVISRCLARDPKGRYADMAALSAALRAGLADDGLSDPAAELRRYFADPPAYNAGLPARIVPVRLTDAERAAQRGERSRALASLERVLQLEPGHARAQQQFARLSKGGRRLPMVLGAALLLVGGGAASWLGLGPHLGPQEKKVASPVVTAPPPPAPVAPPSAPPSPSVSLPDPPPSRVRVARPRPLAEPAVPPAPAPAVVEPEPAPVERTQPALAQLSVRTAPWCDLELDGKKVGRTPQSLSLQPGSHALHCINPSGARLDRTLELVAGEVHTVEERLISPAPLRPRLSRGDAISVDDDAPSATPRSLSVGRHRVRLLLAGQTLESRWVDVPRGGCELKDAPEIGCEAP